VTQKIEQTKKAFPVVASLVRIQLINNLDVDELLHNIERIFMSKSISPKGNSCFIVAMEMVLDIYICPHNKSIPVVCMGGTPKIIERRGSNILACQVRI